MVNGIKISASLLWFRDFLGFQFFLGLLFFFGFTVVAQSATKESIHDKVGQLKDEVVQLNRELFELEEAIIHPANTQIAVFLSLKTKESFLLDSIEISIDGKTATTYLYKESELNALSKGGIQRLYIGNLSSGPHRINAVFNGQGDERYFRREKTYTFEKSDNAKLIEFSIVDSRTKKEPQFSVKEWR
ncbi:AraC family transcriptional regulator [Oleiphilus messinensis]|uniref:AraC family transcriptional regulator n=1 Tax=Oleiphilus messinensis TaxID=141451 RepID=A0A1Y0IA93_9GAMM|nr:hypothetical protein [Oleiphilus messinensis]ARU57381.1 AraC family transcriptional regulator [Oleiphilus messinensis]